MEEDFTDPRDTRLDRLAVRRGWLVLLVIMAIFIALTKIFPSQPAAPTTAPQLTDFQQRDGAKPSH